MSSASQHDEKLKVFISYSRVDSKFADELADGLEYDGGFEVSIDRESIAEGEDWKVRLSSLIADADTVIFVLSPNSVKSPICSWEVDEAHRLAKRIMPVLHKPVDAAAVHPKLAALNYVRFDTERTFMGSLRSLAQALRVDIGWLRDHTRYLGRALSWENAGRPENRLLFGVEVADAKQWLAARPRDAPEPTMLHLDFIRASENAEAERQNVERQQLAEIAAAQEARAQAMQNLARRTRYGLIGLGALVILASAIAAFTYYQNMQLQVASLRLREGMKLKLADTDHIVTSSDKWYRVATDAKLAIATIKGEIGQSSATGFLVDGRSLHRNWTGKRVLLTAAHLFGVSSGQTPSAETLSRFSIAFPAIDEEAAIKFASVLLISKKLDFAVLTLGDNVSKHVQPLVWKLDAAATERLGGVAVLHWTAQDGFSLGFGHGLDRPNGVPEFTEDPLYYTHVTGGGSSGAPVFSTDTGELVCLHQAGIANAPRAWSSCTAMSKIVEEIAAANQTVSSARPDGDDSGSVMPPE